MRGRAIAWVSLLCLAPATTVGQVWEQPWDGVSPGIASSGMQLDFNSPGGWDTISFEDFTVDGQGWVISELQAFGEHTGYPFNFAGGARLVIQQYGDINNRGTVYYDHTYAENHLNSGNPIFTQINVDLAPGHYWVGVYLLSNYQNAQWFWKSSASGTPNAGDTALVHNPSGVLTGTTDPVPITTYGLPERLAMRITYGPGTPEPASWLVLSSTSVLLLLHRRRRRYL